MEITLHFTIIFILSLVWILPKVSLKNSRNDSYLTNNKSNFAKLFKSNLRLVKRYVHESSPQKLSSESDNAGSVKIEEHNKGGVHLIGWDWEKNKNQWLFCLFLLIAAIAKIGYHYSNFLSNFIPESCILILLGLGFGAGIHVLQQTHEVPKFTVDLFFFVLLPPIILESAYSLHDRAFFTNLGTILLYAIMGTFINIALIGPSLYLVKIIKAKWMAFPEISFLELMIFGTAISAVDPVSVLAIFQDLSVNKPLYFLVFGESLLNDAVVIVVHRILTSILGKSQVLALEFVKGFFSFFLVSGGGFIIGVFFGVITSLLTLKTIHVRVIEPMVVVAMAYIAFLTAEIVHFSGIISIIGCGLVQAEYTFKNISRKSRITVKYFTKTLSTVSDLLIFFFLGTMLINETPVWNTSFVLFSLLFCIAYRFVSVFLLTFISNYFFQRVPPIKFEEQILMAYGGLRGAVAFALIAILNTEPGILNFGLLRTTTLVIILFTVFVLGGTTKPLLNFLRIRKEITEDAKLFHLLNNKFIEEIVYGICYVTGVHTFNYYWMQKLVHINDKYIKKFLTHGKKSENIEDLIQKLIFEDEMERIWGMKANDSSHVINSHEDINGNNNNDLHNRRNRKISKTSSIDSQMNTNSSNIGLQNNQTDVDNIGSFKKWINRIYSFGAVLFRFKNPNQISLFNRSNLVMNASIENSIGTTMRILTYPQDLNHILQNAFEENSITQNVLRNSVSKGQLVNRELIKKNLQRRMSVKAMIPGANRSGSSLSRSRSNSLQLYNDINLRRLSVVSNLDIIEDNSNHRN